MSLTGSEHDLRISTPWSLSHRSGMVLLIIVVPVIFLLEWRSEGHFPLTLFYVVPIALAAWNFGRAAGLAIAGVAGASCLAVALATRGVGASLAPVLWQVGSTLAAFVLCALVLAHHRRFIDDVLSLARIDEESGALARREFDRLFEAEVRRGKRYKRPLAIALIEVAAKEPAAPLLAAIARGLGTHVRDGDSVGRLGPLKFAVLLIECPRVEAGLAVARVRDVLAEALGRKAPLKFALVSYGGKGNASAAELMAQAGTLLNIAVPGSREALTDVWFP